MGASKDAFHFMENRLAKEQNRHFCILFQVQVGQASTFFTENNELTNQIARFRDNYKRRNE